LEKAIDSKNESKKIRTLYGNFEKISIDYGIMEKSEDVIVLPSHFPWSDVGSWDSMNVISAPDEQNNIISGQTVNIETKNSTILGKDRLIATLGISDLIIVDTDDALLICHKSKAQDVKKIVEALEKNNHKEFL